MQEPAPIPTPTSWAVRGAWGTGSTLQAREDEGRIAGHDGQPEPVVKDYDEHCASHPLNGKSDQFDGNVQVGVTMQAAKCGTETPSIPVLAPESNVVVVRAESGAAEVEERRDAALLTAQLAHQETQEIPQTDMRIREVGQAR